MAFMGMNMAGQAGRHERAESLSRWARQQAGPAAGRAAPAAAPRRRLDVRLRPDGQHRQVLRQLRPARSRQQPESWTCMCGAVNKGKFCAECGAQTAPGAPKYKCDKCGWEPARTRRHPPKFCPECGDPFDDADTHVANPARTKRGMRHAYPGNQLSVSGLYRPAAFCRRKIAASSTCDYCGSSFDVAEIEALYAPKRRPRPPQPSRRPTRRQKQRRQPRPRLRKPPRYGGWDTSDLSRRLGRGGGRPARLQLPVVRRGADLRREHRGHGLPLLRQPGDRAGAVFGRAEAGLCPPVSSLSKGRRRARRCSAHYKGKPFLPRSFTADNHIAGDPGRVRPVLAV